MPKDIEDEITIEDIEDQEHTGEEVKPSLIVKYGEKLLVEGTDYDVEYGDNIEAGQATAKVILKGNYTGSVQVTFEIVITIPSKITSPSISVDDESAVLSKITAGTKISELLNKLNEKRYLQVRKGSSVITDDILVGTGMTVCIMNNTLIKKQYTVVVTGDVNGDGKINITDMISVKSHILNRTKLNGAYGSAADTNGDDKINITDFIRVKAHILGKSSIIGITAE